MLVLKYQLFLGHLEVLADVDLEVLDQSSFWELQGLVHSGGLATHDSQFQDLNIVGTLLLLVLFFGTDLKRVAEFV